MGQCASSPSSSSLFDPFAFDTVFDPYGLATVLEEVEELVSKPERQIESRELCISWFLPKQHDDGISSSIRDHIKTFQEELRFLRMFVNIVYNYRIHGVFDERISSLLHQVEAGIAQIAKEFLIAGKKFEKVSKLSLAITDFLENIELLKPLVEECCDYMRMNNRLNPCTSYESLGLVQANLQILMEKADLQRMYPLPVVVQVNVFLEKLSSLTNFSANVLSSRTRESYLKPLTFLAGAMAIQAANLSCLWWLRRRTMDECMAEEMANAFVDLHKKLDPASQKLLDMILRLLGNIRSYGDITYPVDMFIHHFLHINREYPVAAAKLANHEPHPLFLEISDLIKSFIEVRKEVKNEVECLLPDMAVVIRLAGSREVRDSLSKERGGGLADLVQFKLTAMLRLLRAEIFVIELLNHRDLSTKRTSYFFFRDAPGFDKIARGQVGVLRLHSEPVRHKSADLLEDNMEFWQQVYTLSLELAKELNLLPNSFNAGKITRFSARRLLLKWLTSILVFRAVAYLLDLYSSNENLILVAEDQVGTLKCLVASLTTMPKKLIFVDLENVTKDEIQILMLTQSVARQVLSLYHSFHAAQFTVDMMQELNNRLSFLIEKTKQVIGEIDIQLPHIKFPNTNGLGFIDFLLIKLTELLKYESDSVFLKVHKREHLKYECGSIEFVKKQIKVIVANLGSLRSFLDEQDFMHQELKELGILVTDAAYKVELIVDSIVLGNGSQRKNLSWLYHVSENIRHMKMQVIEFEEACYGGVRNGAQTVGSEISLTRTSEIAENVVLLDDQQRVIVDQLASGLLQRAVALQTSQVSNSEIEEDVLVLNDQRQMIVDQLASTSLQRAVGLQVSQVSKCEIDEDVAVYDQQPVIADRLTRGSSRRAVWRENSLIEVTEDADVINDQPQVIVDRIRRGTSQRNAGFQISQTSNFEINEDVVAREDQQQVIIDRLTRGTLQRDIISIVGMPGIGKTTLANRVYRDPEVVYYFHIRAWCSVSQVYTKRDLLLEILGHIIELTDSILMMNNEDLEFVLYKNLKRRRYLIFMDDMWNIGAWDDLKSSFPDDENGSRILITSRLRDVVLKVTFENDLLDLRPLSEEESWELLKMKIFPTEGCPEELVEVGKEIARNCKGLPLSIVAIAGLLQGKDMKPDSWKQIAVSLNSIMLVDPHMRCMDILELSYKHLPDYLKACFLYLGAFPEDKEIPVRRLIWLWMAEGFLPKRDSRSLEDLGEGYLTDLIGRSLITVAKRRSNGRVKVCRVHDMVRNLCLLKAREENFLKLVSSSDEPYASFDDNVDFDDFDPSNSVIYEEHRLCMSISRQHFVMSRPSGPYVRSLMFFATIDAYPRCPYNVSFISENFKLLKVLDLESINMGSSFADGIDLLVQLSYLAVGGDIDSIPSSLANLRNLETLVVKKLKGKVVLPDSIWGMTRLRHVHVTSHAAFTLKNIRSGSYCQLNNLVSLSMPTLSYGEYTEVIIRRLPNLRELSCIFSQPRGFSTDCYQFPRFEGLTQLESLKVVYRGKTINTGEFNFPSSLKKLSLSNFFLRQDHISAIGGLANLEVLKLLSSTFEDAIWEMGESEFTELKFLKLDSLNIVEWNASCDHLPNLRQLVLQRCENLREVPIDFVNIPTLQLIEVQRCGESVEQSVRRLKEEQLEYGIEDLKVLINH